MKNILFKSLAAVVLLGGLSSCSDFLEQSSPSSLDGKNIFSNYEYAQGTIANIYQEFGEQNYRARAIWYGYNTDIEIFSGSDKADGRPPMGAPGERPAMEKDNVEKMQKAAAKKEKKIRKILTTEQYAKWQEMRQPQEPPHPQDHPHKPNL